MRWIRLARDSDKDDRERGAVAVTVALLLVVLVGLTAFAVDAGRMVSTKAQLQNGADASALAVAQTCSKSAAACTQAGANTLADQYTPANYLDHTAIRQGNVDLSVAGKATVKTSTNGNLALIFGGVLGIGSTPVTATATATWGGPLTGPAALPIAVAPCQIIPDTGKTQFIYLKSDKNSDALNTTCAPDNTAHGPLTGGFEWLVTDPNTCTTTVKTDPSGQAYVMSDTGVNVAKECKTEFPSLLDQTVVLPIFSGVSGNGAGGRYYVVQWAAVKLIGYRINPIKGGVDVPGGSDTRGIAVQFISFVADPSKYTGGGGTSGGVTLPPTLIK